MRLFTKDIDKQLFAQYSKGSDLANQKVVAKIFNPYGRGTWYLINSDPYDPNYLWAIVDLFEVEVGSVSRMDLETIKVPPFRLGLERDMSFTPINAQELFDGLLQGKRYEKGGSVADSNKEMLLNQAEGFEHHAEEFESAVKKADEIPAWVVAKSQRASTDLSDITHYLDGENEQKREIKEGEEYAKGGKVGSKIKYQGKEGKIISKKGDMYFVQVENFYPNGDSLNSVLREGEFEKMANGGMSDSLKDTYDRIDNQRMLARSKVASIIGIDEALNYMNKDYVVSPFNLIESAVVKGFITTDEINKGLWDAAVDEANDIDSDYRDSGEGIGTSDMNAFISRMLNDAGIKVGVVNNRYKRMAKGGEFGVDKHRVYFSSFAEVMEAINDIANENGYNVVDIFPDLSYGGVGYGQTKRAKVELEWNGKDKMGKSKKREKNTLNVQIYRMDSGNYELNSYFSYAYGGYMAKGGEFGDFYEFSKKYVKKNFGSDFDEGYPMVQYEKEGSKKEIESAFGVLKNGKKVYFDEDEVMWKEGDKMAMGGVTFKDKVKAVKSSLLKRKKVSPSVQKDYGKTYSPKEAEESAKRIVGAMTARERLKMKMAKKKKK